MPYGPYMPDEQSEGDIGSAIEEAGQAAQQQYQQGNHLVFAPEPLPPLTRGMVKMLRPEQVAQIIAARRAEKARRLLEAQRKQVLMDTHLASKERERQRKSANTEHDRRKGETEQTQRNVLDRAGIQFATEWKSALDENKTATDAKFEAERSLEELKKKAASFGTSMLPVPTDEKPNPQQGIYAVPFKFNAVVPANENPVATLKRKIAAASLNDDVAKRTKEYNEAVRLWLERSYATKDLEEQTLGQGFRIAPDESTIFHPVLGKAFKIGSGTKQGNNDVKSSETERRFIYDSSRPDKLIPKF